MVKNPRGNAGDKRDVGSTPGLGRSHRREHGNPLQYFESSSGGSDGIESTSNAGDLGLIPGSGRAPGKWNGNPLQYSYLEKSMDRGAWQEESMGHKESDTTERLTHTQSIE